MINIARSINRSNMIVPNNLLNAALKNKGVKAGIVNAGKPLPMLSVQDAVNENLIEPIFIGDEKEILKCAEDLKWDISKYEIINEPVENNTAAIAAKLHDPSRFVLCFAGDGDFQMNGNELGSAMQAGLPLIILIVNNGTYGTIRMHQERHYPERVSGTELVNPDFVTLAKAYGFYGERVEKTEDFAAAFARACESKTGAVLDLVVATEAITPRQSINDLRKTSV